uniref:KTSC domain-containing protein n=1 Tax=Steinernema glaseri TaxID=37863 RepID=A0A1I7Y5A4_9BILA
MLKDVINHKKVAPDIGDPYLYRVSLRVSKGFYYRIYSPSVARLYLSFLDILLLRQRKRISFNVTKLKGFQGFP